MAEVLYVWRRLRHPLTGSDSLTICWDRAGAQHFIEDRAHFREAESLWRRVVPAEVIEPVLQLQETARPESDAALRRFAQWLEPPLRSVYAAPRVLVIESIPKGAACGRMTMIVIPQFGACFISKRVESDHYEWRTMYFPRSLVNGLALFPESFAQTTIREIVETYTAAGTVLPDPDNPAHSVERRHEVDGAIRFIEPRVWGFESDRPGARWLGVPQDTHKEVTE